MIRRVILCVLAVQTGATLYGQDLTEEFAKFRSGQKREFLEEQRRQDSIFALAIRENWRSFQLNEPYEYLPEYPKPEAQPEDTGEIEPSNYSAKPEVKKLRSFEPVAYEAIDFYPEEDLESELVFYGEERHVNYPASLLHSIDEEPSKEFVSDFWSVTSRLPYQKLVNELIGIKGQLNIPGFGLVLLLDDFVATLDISPLKRSMYQWFLLSKAGYNARVGFSNGKPILIIASSTVIYGRPYFQDGNTTYYVLDEEVRQIDTYVEVETKATAPVDFGFVEAPDLPLNPRSKQFEFVHGEVEYEWEVYYNKNVVDLMEEFPLVDLPPYFNSKGSFLLEKSLRKEISSDLEGKTQMEVIGLLLSFMQKGFEYETDQSQFGREKVLFPDQLIHYTTSDCDDRVVFLNYLLGLFTEVETVALLFPQHIALGVDLPVTTYGESVDVHGKRFIFCDPTYYNAPLGSVIPQADRNKMKVLSF